MKKSQQSLWPRPSPCSFLPSHQHWCSLLWPGMACGDPLSRTYEYNKLLSFKTDSLVAAPSLSYHTQHVHSYNRFLLLLIAISKIYRTPSDTVLTRNHTTVFLKDHLSASQHFFWLHLLFLFFLFPPFFPPWYSFAWSSHLTISIFLYLVNSTSLVPTFTFYPFLTCLEAYQLEQPGTYLWSCKARFI